MKFLLDVNLSIRWEQVLSSAGWEAVHWYRLGSPNTPDDEIMVFAADHGWIVVTHDLDFGAALALNRLDKPSVIQIRSGDMDPSLLGVELVATIRSAADELEDGALLIFSTLKSRIRLLPLR